METAAQRQIFLVNNDAGTANNMNLPPDPMTVGQLFAQQLPGKNVSDYMTRVNQNHVAGDYELQAQDVVAFTPTKVQGA